MFENHFFIKSFFWTNSSQLIQAILLKILTLKKPHYNDTTLKFLLNSHTYSFPVCSFTFDFVLFMWQEEIFVTRAPGRLDVMGGIADYSGSLVLQVESISQGFWGSLHLIHIVSTINFFTWFDIYVYTLLWTRCSKI